MIFFLRKINKVTTFLFYLSLTFCSLSQAEEIKYYDQWGCGVFFEVENRCIFAYEIDRNNLSNAWFYFEVHYDQGKLTKAIRFANNAMELYGKKPKPTIAEKLKFDFKERITQHEIFLHDPSPNKYRICKTIYGENLKESKCYNKKGKMMHRTVWVYKNKLLEKRYWYDEANVLKEFSIYDHEKRTVSIFSGDHKLIEKKDLDEES